MERAFEALGILLAIALLYLFVTIVVQLYRAVPHDALPQEPTIDLTQTTH